MINGLIRGMNNRTGPLYATARRIVQQTISEMRSEAEIASPSKITTTYGEFLMDGWIVGIKRRIGLAKETARGAVSSVLNEFAGDTMPGATRQLREAEGAAGVYNAGNTYNTTQNIYAQKQSPSEMLREAQWLAKRAVTIGV